MHKILCMYVCMYVCMYIFFTDQDPQVYVCMYVCTVCMLLSTNDDLFHYVPSLIVITSLHIHTYIHTYIHTVLFMHFDVK
jgi:hypothetical protein